MAAMGGGAPISSGYGQPPKVRLEVVSEAFQLYMQQVVTWILAILICALALAIPGIVMGMGIMGAITAMLAAGEHGGAALGGIGMIMSILIGGALSVVIGAVVMGGMFRIAIKQIRGETVQLSDLWSVTDVIGQLIVAGILIYLATTVAEMVCILPVFPVSALLMLTVPLIVDQKLSAMDALSRSWNTLKSDWAMATGLVLIFLVLGILSGFLAGLGIFVVGPVILLSVALVYRDFFLGGAPPPGAPVGVTPGGPSPDLYAAQPPPPPYEPR